MRILSRYIFREILSYFFICLITFTALILTARSIKLAHLIVNKGVDIAQVAKVFIAIVPTFLEFALPMSVLLGVMLAFARLSGDSEIIVIRASGIKLTTLLKPVIIFGFLVSIFAFYLSFELRPLGYKTVNQTLFDIARSKSIAGISAGFFNPLGKLTIYAEEIDYDTGAMKRVMINDRRESNKVVFAKTGQISGDNQKQELSIDLFDGSLHEKPEEQYELTRFTRNTIILSTADIYGDVSLVEDKRGRELNLGELNNHITKLRNELASEESLLKYKRFLIEKAGRFALPWACFLMALFAVPLGIQPPRTQKTWGASLSLALGLSAFILYFGALTIGMTLAENGAIAPVVGVWIPNIFLILAAGYTIRKTTSEAWQSPVDGIEYVVRSIFRKRQ